MAARKIDDISVCKAVKRLILSVADPIDKKTVRAYVTALCANPDADKLSDTDNPSQTVIREKEMS